VPEQNGNLGMGLSGIAVSIGIGLGAILGVAIGNIFIGVPIGLTLGGGLAIWLRRWRAAQEYPEHGNLPVPVLGLAVIALIGGFAALVHYILT